MPKFEGVCIGGPKHGMTLSGYDRLLRFPKRVPAPITVPAHEGNQPSAEKIEDDRYEFVSMHFSQGDISYWRHQSMPSHYEALHAMLNTLAMSN